DEHADPLPGDGRWWSYVVALIVSHSSIGGSMAADNLTTEWHLTPTGWVRGTTRFFSAVQGEEISAPTNRVLTVETLIYQRSGWSAEERSVSDIWKSKTVSAEQIEDLRQKYPLPFKLR